jgi:hypothetical protein
VDTDSDGILNEEQFLALLQRELSPFLPALSQDDMNYFLQVLDPFNCQKITFSECVQLFSAHLVPEGAADGDMLEGTPLKGGRIPDREGPDMDPHETRMVPVIERVN